MASWWRPDLVDHDATIFDRCPEKPRNHAQFSDEESNLCVRSPSGRNHALPGSERVDRAGAEEMKRD
jgi:hypothetical protein